MKNIVIVISLVSSLCIGVQAYDQVDRVEDMQMMETSMAKIQKGILYNNNKIILQGVNGLKKASAKVEVTDKTDMDYSSKFAKQKAENIMKFADKIRENATENHLHSVSSNYTKVLNQCISCHNKIRKWNK
jgi:cytochrome c556